MSFKSVQKTQRTRIPIVSHAVHRSKMATNSKNNILLLFDRPTEPVFLPKGEGNIAFDVPSNYLTEEYKNIGPQLVSRLDSENVVSVKNISIPDITTLLELGRREQFSLFIPKHAAIASRLVNMLMGARDLDDLLSMSAYCRDRINPYLFNYALSVTLLHRNDTRDVRIPNVFECFPDKFLDGSVFARAREQANVVPDGSREPITIPRDYTGTDADPEHRVAYFREDLGINLHHWHWHLVYPFMGDNRTIVDKDRRGELFYYMHEQIQARYNCERLSNQLGRVRPLNNLREPIPEGYFPKLDSTVSSRSWPPRFVNATLSDINRPNDQLRIEIANVEQWMNQIRTVIGQGFVEDNNQQRQQLTEERGIDILGNLVESVSLLTVNENLYGNLHNAGHMLLALAHDPDGRFLETFSVMGDSNTAMRDPVFYRFHETVNNLFLMYKSRLPSYTQARLTFPGVAVNSIQVEVERGQQNRLETFWQQSDIDMSRGLDFTPRGSVFVRFTHLQHRPFTYRIQVNNTTQNQLQGYVRIFIGPRLDERNRVFSFNEQRILMIELDKFRVGLRPGQNLIVRRSDESSVTIPYERTFRNLTRPTGNDAVNQFNFCGCGWPQHMLIPKGTEGGMEMDLFVMISNYTADRVDQGNSVSVCAEADSYCGVFNRRYPDRQSMGYPFDRNARNGVNSLDNFLTTNMAVQRVTIAHRNQTVVRANTNTNTNTNTNANPTTNRS